MEAFRTQGVNAVAAPREPRLPHPHRGPGGEAAARHAAAPAPRTAVDSRSSPTRPARSTRRGPSSVPKMIDLLGEQVGLPVQFVKGLETLYAAGARVFVEVGPKKALHGFVEDVLGEREGVVALFTNHPKVGEEASLNHALCGLWAAGLGVGGAAERARSRAGAGLARTPSRSSAGSSRSSSSAASGSWAETAADRDARAPRRHGSRPRPSRRRAGVRRAQRAAHPRRRAGHRPDPYPLPPGDGREAHHAPGEGGSRRSPLRRDRHAPPR